MWWIGSFDQKAQLLAFVALALHLEAKKSCALYEHAHGAAFAIWPAEETMHMLMLWSRSQQKPKIQDSQESCPLGLGSVVKDKPILNFLYILWTYSQIASILEAYKYNTFLFAANVTQACRTESIYYKTVLAYNSAEKLKNVSRSRVWSAFRQAYVLQQTRRSQLL